MTTTRDAFDGFLVLIVLVLLVALFSVVGERDLREQELLEKHISQANERREFPACDGATIKQFAAAERWSPKGDEKPAECVRGAREIPPYVLTSPLGEAK